MKYFLFLLDGKCPSMITVAGQPSRTWHSIRIGKYEIKIKN